MYDDERNEVTVTTLPDGLSEAEQADFDGRMRLGQGHNEARKEIIENRLGSEEPAVAPSVSRVEAVTWPAGYEGPFYRGGRGVFDVSGRMLATCGDAQTSAASAKTLADMIAAILNRA